jgi:hypothetical protein
MKAASGAIRGVRLLGLLVALVAASVWIHGYHYGIEDEAIYLPAIKAHLNPALYPHDAIFFELQTRPMLFDELVAATARVLHLALDWTVFAYYLGTLLAFLGGVWAVQARLFRGDRGRLGGVFLVAVLLTLPVAGTCVFLVDQHLHPRTLATALILLAAAVMVPKAQGEKLATREYVWIAVLTIAAATMHPQMAFYEALLLVVWWLPERALGGAAVADCGGDELCAVRVVSGFAPCGVAGAGDGQ